MSATPQTRPRVLQVLQPPDGGVAEHVLRLCLGLPARGFDVEVALAADSAIRDRLEAAGVTTHVLPLQREPAPADVRAARALRELDAERGYAVVHAHSSKAGVLVRAALRDTGRLVYTPHCFSFAAELGRGRALYRLVERALAPRCGTIVASSEWERREAERALPAARRRLAVIHYGVDAAAGARPDPDLVEFAAGRPLAGMVSVLREQKNPLSLVRAVARLAAADALPGRVAIVGNGPLRDDVVGEIDRLGVGEHIRWFPFEGEVWPYLAALDLFVLPSRWESLPIAIPEAMSTGLPVLSTTVCGIPEAVADGENGRLVPPEDVPALAAALGEMLAGRDELRAMGARSRERAERLFMLERMVDEVAALYGERAGLREAA